MEEALLYIRIYFISIPFMLIYNFGSAILRSYGDSKRPMYYLCRRTDEFSFRFSKMTIVRIDLKRILVIGIPAGIQEAIFSISNVFIQSGINSFGEDAIAGSSLALNFEYFTYDIAAAFAQAAVTFTSQNFGAGNLKRCKKTFWRCMLFGTVVFRLIWMVTVFRLVPTYEMLMNVYIASWIFTGGAIFIVYILHMRKLEKRNG